MGTIASELKAEREKRNIPLAHIAAETRISLRHLESLEEGRYGDMPGGIYNRAFLKAYCEILNLDATEMLRRFDAELALVSERSSRNRPRTPSRTSSFNFARVFVWGFMLVIAGVGIYSSRKWIAAVFSPYFSHTSASAIHLEVARPPGELKTQKVVPSATAASQSSPADTAFPQTPETEEATAQPVSAVPPTASPAIRLEVIATDQSWVSIERDGTVALRKIMEPGEIQSFDASDKFLIIVGNAGGVNLKINGKPAKPLGKPGSVVRLLIERGNLQDFLDQTAG
jgi:cytoskeleton protein RodZ